MWGRVAAVSAVGVLAAAGLGVAPSAAGRSSVHALHRGQSSKELGNGIRFRVRYESVECRRAFPGMALDPDTYDDTDAVAASGKKLCLVTLAVRNIDRRPGFWYISYSSDAVLRTSRRWAYSPWDEPYSQGQIAILRGVEFAGDSNYIQPRETQYDFILYEIPKRLRPRALEIPQ